MNKIKILSLILSAVSAFTAFASDKSLVYDRISVKMYINQDTSIDVEETQHVRMYGKWNGLFRHYYLKGFDEIKITDLFENDKPYQKGDISVKEWYSLEYKKENNALFSPKIIEIKWRSRDVNDLGYGEKVKRRRTRRRSSKSRFIKPQITKEVEVEDEYLDPKRTFTIKYTLIGGIAQYFNKDVFNYKPLFENRKAAVLNADVEIFFPEPINEIDVKLNSIIKDSSYKILNNGESILFESNGEVPKKDDFAIEVTIPSGILDKYQSFNNLLHYFIKPYIFIIGIPFIILILFIIQKRWNNIGLNNKEKRLDITKYPPGLAGMIIDNNFDSRDILATIIDLAKRGYLKIEDLGYKDFALTLCKKAKRGDLKWFEVLILTGLFGSATIGTTVTNSVLKNNFYSHIDKIKSSIEEDAEQLNIFQIIPNKMKKMCAIYGGSIIGIGTAIYAIEYPIALFLIIFLLVGITAFYGSIYTLITNGFDMLFIFGLFFSACFGGLSSTCFVLGFNYSSTIFVPIGAFLMVSGIIVVYSGLFLSKKGEEGNALYKSCCDLRKALKLRNSQSNLAKSLSWAVALGVEKKLIKSVAENTISEISYYKTFNPITSSSSSKSPLDILTFSKSFSSFVSSMNDALTSAPRTSGRGSSYRSSSSGGGGGGGSSSSGGGGW